MSLYLKRISLDEAKNISREVCSKIELQKEIINTWESSGRVTYSSHYAKVSSPHFTASAMDGIATCFKYTIDASSKKPITLGEGMFEVVDTGDQVKTPFDCVIMIEDVEESENGYIIRKSAVPYQNIRPIGEDIRVGEMVVSKKKVITPLEMSSLLAAKITQIEVYKNLTVGIIPTGDEIVDAREESFPKNGELVDYNSWTFKALIESFGAKGIRYDVVKDNKEDLKEALLKACEECDMVILNAGTSKGRGDYAGEVIEKIGETIFRGIAIKPGKPASLSIINNTPIFGVPGYPVSGFFIIDTLVKEGIDAVLSKIKKVDLKYDTLEAYLSRKAVSSLKNDEYIRVKLGKVGDQVIASPMGKGAGATMSLTKADGFFLVPKNVEGYENGSKVEVNILRKDFNIDDTLISIGSNDMLMDIVSDVFKNYNLNLSSTSVGSLGGIMALKRGEAHIAPIHLLGENGVYNIDICNKYLEDCVLIKLVKRNQGFIVEKGNPLNIKDFKDLERAAFVNSQKGSGTRVLLDYYLEKNNINKSSINGYDREEITNLSIAAQIKGKSADCGLGVESAAKMMDLDFVPICSEDYDIVLRKEMLNDYRVKTFLDIVTSKEFKERLDSIGGYDLSSVGKVVVLGG